MEDDELELEQQTNEEEHGEVLDQQPDGNQDQDSDQGQGDGQPSGEAGDEAGATGGEPADDELVVTIGDEQPAEEPEDKAPEWVRELRKNHRETVRRNRELEEQLKALQAPAKVEVGPKPKLEDFEFDTDEYETALSNWYETKRQADEAEANAQATKEEQERAWQNRLKEYGEGKTKLSFKDVDEAEAVVLDLLDQTQQGIVIQGAENPALVVYALGKNEARAKELSTIKDPVKFAFAVAKLEKDLKVTNRKGTPPAPEKKPGAHGTGAGAADSTLERLRAEAEKTGDFTKVVQYKRQKRQANAQNR